MFYTCMVHPKTPIISMAMHRYSEKTSHHGFKTRNRGFCSEVMFRNSLTGIILESACQVGRLDVNNNGYKNKHNLAISQYEISQMQLSPFSTYKLYFSENFNMFSQVFKYGITLESLYLSSEREHFGWNVVCLSTTKKHGQIPLASE